ncbi:signal peptidase II [Cyanobium sp. CH-040]|uniref:signal peptidase II n=1 Tax=Cyanobium sp. CH-040 TaxID=2823708 RepID=UPI0020CBBC64|nr:signal peptidase II [Cyanobium sp. CH-040]MCP9926901.1 signal peptidase II [Cyanobium sp. CH-040]
MSGPARSPRRLSLGLAAAVVLADQLTKAWASDHLAGRPARPFIPGLLEFTHTTNTGAAFSLFSGSSTLLGLVSLAVAVGVTVWIWRQGRAPHSLARGLALGLLLGGAIGNGIDRWRLGAVVDFLALMPVSFPVFNLADVAINLAVLCFVIDLFAPEPGDGRRR